jgi:hydroxyacylglutathione hydrolase
VAEVFRIVTGPWKENCYVVSASGDAVVIDPGGEFERIQEHVSGAGLTVHAVINTHAHYDHLGAVVPVVEAHGAPFHLHGADAGLLKRANFYRALFLGEETIRIPGVDVDLDGVTSLRFGALEVGVLHTPGHTPGSVCFAVDGELFTGDTVMARHLGRTDLPGADRELLLESARALVEGHPRGTRLYPGHGPETSIADVAPQLEALPELRG